MLDVQNLKAAYGQMEVLRGITLKVDEGEVVSLIGRNGAGKTTTLRSILGTVTITGGSVQFRGEDITAVTPEETVTRGISIVPEHRRVFQELTTRENLEVAALGGTDEGISYEIDEVLEMFDPLRRNEQGRAMNLSGGEQQMLAIGRALVAGTRLLMLDEPTEGLAPFIVEQVEDLITELSEDGLTILMVEQNIEAALNVCHRHYIIDKGELVYSGSTDELRERDDVVRQHLGVTV